MFVVTRDGGCRDQELSWQFSSEFGNFSFSSLLVSAMPLNSGEQCQNVHTVVVLPNGGATNPQYEPVPNVIHVEVRNLIKNKICLNSESNLLSYGDLKMGKVNKYAPSILDVDIEQGNTETPKATEETISNSNSDDSLARPLQRGICLQLGGKFMQFLMKYSPELPKVSSKDKLLAERAYDTPTSRSRKYKRSQSFNSRRVVLMFSIMSIVGTIILICLTLRVRLLISDGSGNGLVQSSILLCVDKLFRQSWLLATDVAIELKVFELALGIELAKLH
ncbi:hypothetical protein BUALT_Bualt04G0022800 [Buddleja alternifolia]|uniref:Uncharacterized protein n=1 Tax=Buddleja alternifolia TaxID=168488 RepID=A0AAV6XTR7_9LAMI|nr:hypothetical protein BUALT_Bualt04G0022800 [Buddleja alternifolia]